MADSSCLTKSMLSTIHRFSMIQGVDTVLVAVSGGPDSVALLHALHSQRELLGIDLHVAHLNHCFRGDDSDADAVYVEELSRNLDILSTIEKIDVPMIKELHGGSPEETARIVRYEFLEGLADRIGADKIALGHTADDQVETVMLNILRGTGIDGLSGMPAVRGKLIRPLLEVRRSKVEEYIAQHSLQPRTDATNFQTEYTRNRVRLELLPFLRTNFNSDIDAALLRLGELAREDSAYLNIEAQESLTGLIACKKDGEVNLHADRVLALPLAIRRRLIRGAIRLILNDIMDIGFIHVESILRMLDAGSDFVSDFPHGLFVRRSGNCLAFLSTRPNSEPIVYCYEITIPGRTCIAEIESEIETELTNTPISPIRPQGSTEVVIDHGMVKGKLRVRSWNAGDRIQPFGMKGFKKVQDILVDAKVPRAIRDRVPIIVDDDKIIWVAGLTLSESVRVNESTHDFMVIRMMRAQTCGHV